MRRLDPKESAVLVVDIQERLAPAMPEAAMKDVQRAATILIEAGHLLGARILATEQYPAGLGSTVPTISALLSRVSATVVAKTEFSACDSSEFDRVLIECQAKSIIVVGVETHVCVFQTVRDLVARGLSVLVPVDGVASRREDHRLTGLDLCRSAGATLTTAETVAFDWLRRAGTSEFKTVSKLVR